MDKRSQHIQALLFAEGGALSFKSLLKILGCSEAELKTSLDSLAQTLDGSGLALLRSDSEASLVISNDARDVVVQKAHDENNRDIGDAGLEVLAVLLYEGPSTRSDVDYIRGVNSSSTIRNLLARGLVERTGNPEDAREYVYRATSELLAHIGVTEREKLPEYATIAPELATFKNSREETTHGTDTHTEAGT